MYGKATLNLPQGERYEGLSDALAMSFGRIAAWTLSDEDEFVTVTLESGSVRVIGLDTILGKLSVGRLHPNYRPLDLSRSRA